MHEVNPGTMIAPTTIGLIQDKGTAKIVDKISTGLVG